MAPLRERAAKAGTAIFDPNGVALRSHQLTWTLSCLADLLRSDSVPAAGRLLRLPAVLQAAGVRSPELLLREWDEFCQAHLPRTLTDALVLAGRWKPRLRNFPGQLETGAPADAPVAGGRMPGAAGEQGRRGTQSVHGPDLRRRFRQAPTSRTFIEALDLWQETMESLDTAVARTGSEFDTATLLDTALHLLRGARLYPDNALEAPVLHGVAGAAVAAGAASGGGRCE